MKRNIKYIKDVLSKISRSKQEVKEKLFYSIGILLILFVVVDRFNKIEKKPVIIIDTEVKEEKTKVYKEMSFKEKFKASRAYHGPNGLFLWRGKTYHCKYKEEMEIVDPCN